MQHHHKRTPATPASALLVCVLLWPLAGHAGQADTTAEPLWEAGAGVGGVVYPHYRGSRDYEALAAPLPIVIYRGDILKVSRDGARAQVVDNPHFEINFSGAGAPPVDSDDDELRRGMPDLDPVVEFGPRLSWLFTDPGQRDTRSLRLDLSVYGAAATDLHDFETIGWVIKPRLRWHRRYAFPERDAAWSYSLSAGPLFAANDYHDYYYSVAPRFATASRPAFNAGGGYSGFSATGGVYHRRGNLRLGATLSADYLGGAAFADSPLVATKASYVAALFIAWTFWESEARAPEHDAE